MQLVHTENYPCFPASAFAPRPLRSVLFCTEKKPESSSSSQQLLRGHIRQHNSYVCLTGSSSHPCPARAGSTLHIPNRWARCPRRFGTKLTTNKTAQGLRRYSLINHTHLCRRIRRTLSLWCLNPNWKTSPSHTDCAGLGSGRGDACVCEHLLWGNKGVHSSKEPRLPPVAQQPSKHRGVVQDQWTEWGLEFEFQSSMQNPFRNQSAVCKRQQTLMKFHLCINWQNRKNALWTPM